MNIAYFILPILVGLAVGVSIFVAQQINLTGHIISTNVQSNQNKETTQHQPTENKTECSVSCDDNNPCSIDWCNESSNYFCAHIPINGTSDGCWGNPATCTTNICISGKCAQTQIRNCCGNNICESSESCNSCASDCGECPIITQAVNKEQPAQPISEAQPQTNQTNTTLVQPNNASNETTNITNTTSNQTTQPSLTHIIVSEVQTGPNEFVELYNPTNADVDATGWYLSYFSSSRNWNDTYRNWVFPNNTILKTGKFFLISIFNTTNADWTVLTAGGTPYSQGQISNNGSIAVFPFNPRTNTSEEARNGRIDTLGWSKPIYVFESSPATSPVDGKSLQRSSLNSDTDNNSQDFVLSDSPSPKNSTNQ